MPLDITFTLSDEDLERFQSIIDKARTNLDTEAGAAQIQAAAQALIDESRNTNLPEFIADRLQKLEVIINMVQDDEWQLNDFERRRVLSALVYFCDPDDIIPDHIPGIGFLDDAIYVQMVVKELQAEIDSYEEFCAYRNREEKRRKEQGLDPYVDRESWLSDKRAALHSRMRKRRSAAASAGGWKMRLW
jgi:uncharacterized membrane protein YkvA (DUF1232 family)